MTLKDIVRALLKVIENTRYVSFIANFNMQCSKWTSLKQSDSEFCVVCRDSCVAAKSLFVKSIRPFSAFTAWSVSLVIFALLSSRFVSTAVMSCRTVAMISSTSAGDYRRVLGRFV